MDYLFSFFHGLTFWTLLCVSNCPEHIFGSAPVFYNLQPSQFFEKNYFICPGKTGSYTLGARLLVNFNSFLLTVVCCTG